MARKICKIILFPILFSVVFVYAGEQIWNIPIMPLREIKSGMVGVGKTVFYGEQIEEFGVEVIDVMNNFYPRRDMIIVRLTGDRAELHGVVSGMSGSPVYIDNKLVGALAMRFGDFMKEPIGGVVPIEEMLEIVEKEQLRDREEKQSFSLLPLYLKGVLATAPENFWSNVVGHFTEAGLLLKNRIESQLVFSGFSEQVLGKYAREIHTLGFSAALGGSSSATQDKPMHLEPGSAIAQVFVTGDLGINATGTVTAVHENKVLAFGHFIFNMGPINLPMAQSRVLVTLPSLMGSNKMTMAGDIIGTIRQDRISGVFGDLGTIPDMIPVRLTLLAENTEKKEYHFKLASDPALDNLMPFFLRIALYQAIVAGRLAATPSSLELDGRFELSDQRQVKINDFFSYEQKLGFMGAGSEVGEASDLAASVLGILSVNDFKKPKVKGIDLSVRLKNGEKLASIQSIWQDKIEVDPGDSLRLTILLKRSDGSDWKITRWFQLPDQLDDNMLTVLVGSARAMTQYDVRRNPGKYRPKNFEQLLAILEERRQNSKLYIQIRTPDTGLLVAGEELAALPPSVLQIMKARGTNGDFKALRERILCEEVIPTDVKISGIKAIKVRVRRPEKAPPSPEEQEPARMIFDW